MKRDWSQAEEKRGCRRVCGHHSTDLAHTIGRAYDSAVVNPDAVVPLCNAFGNDCHGKYDRRELDLLPYLDIDEQIYCVDALGGIEVAWKRLTGNKPH